MSRFYYGFPEYVPVAAKREKSQKKLSELKKKNPNIKPVVIEGNTISKSWWGKAWNSNLERYSDYENRIGRGRSYVRNGAVLDLQIAAGMITALVQGSSSRPYKVTVKIEKINSKKWTNIRKSCEGKLDSLEELIEGVFPKSLGDIFTAKGQGLFPSPDEIEFDCSCPDWASMCKHVAAVLYGVSVRLDADPSLLFLLRNADLNRLIFQTVENKSKKMLKKSGVKSSRIIEDQDISAMFGIEMDAAQGIKKGAAPVKRSADKVSKKASKKK